jgi:hypothetical protein
MEGWGLQTLLNSATSGNSYKSLSVDLLMGKTLGSESFRV